MKRNNGKRSSTAHTGKKEVAIWQPLLNWTCQNLLLFLVIFRIGFYRVCNRACDYTVGNLAFAVES